MENEKGIIEQFCKSAMNSLNYEEKIPCHISVAFETHLYKDGSNIGKAVYKSYVSKSKDGIYTLNLQIEDKNSACPQKAFHIEENMIIKAKSSETQITFEDKDGFIWIIKHC